MELKIIHRNFLQKLRTMYTDGEADAIARIVFEHFISITNKEIALNPGMQLSKKNVADIDGALEKLMQHVPVQYITGFVNFCDLNFRITPAALIPRPETEELTQHILKAIPDNKPIQIIDIGTGSGCIPISIKHHKPEAMVTGIDKSKVALELAEQNARALGGDVRFLEIDFLNEANWIRLNRFNIIISNPPYVPVSDQSRMDPNVLKYEPHIALFVPENRPLLFYEKIAEFSVDHLHSDGEIWLELYDVLSAEILHVFVERGFKGEIFKDVSGKDRFLHLIHRSR